MTEIELGDYRRWLYKVAADLLPGGPFDPGVDDLVQEGRLAMWRAVDTHDPAKGSIVSWITVAARNRMRDLAWGHGRPTGHAPVRGFTEAQVAASLDAMEDTQELALAESVIEFAEPVLMEVLRELPEKAREYIWLRFWCGVEVTSRAPGTKAVAARHPVLKERWVWDRARKKLSQDPRIQALAAA